MEEKAVKKAFPKLSASSIATIANWYINEGASEDFSTIRDFADFIESDFLDMFWAGDYDKDEFKEVAKDMISNGYYDEDDFPYEEEDCEDVEQSCQKEKKDPYDIRDMVITDTREPTDEMFYRYLDFCRAKLGIDAYTFKVPSGRFEEVRKAFDEFMSNLSDEEIEDMRLFRRCKHKIGWFKLQQNEEGYYTSESAATHEKKVYDVPCTFDEFAKLEFRNNYSNVAYCVVEFNDDEEGLIENIPLSLQVFPIRKPGQDRLYLYEPANGTNIPREQIAKIWVCSKDLKTSKLSESRRDYTILRGFKKGYEALADALETRLPTAWGFVTDFRFRQGSDDFNGDYIIEMSFDTIDASNIRYYIDGDVKRVKMTTYSDHEKAIANLINETVDFDDVYVMEGPIGKISLYITNATPANEHPYSLFEKANRTVINGKDILDKEQPLEEARISIPKEKFEFSDVLRETWYILEEHGFSPKKKEEKERTKDKPTTGQISVIDESEIKILEISLTGEYVDDIIIKYQWYLGKTQVDIFATGFPEDMAWMCLSLDEFSHDFDECLSECMKVINK